MTIFLDANPLGGGIGIFMAVAFFLVLLAVAFIAFKLLKKSVKMAIRVVIVIVILAIAIVGGLSFYMLSTAKSPRPTPTRSR